MLLLGCTCTVAVCCAHRHTKVTAEVKCSPHLLATVQYNTILLRRAMMVCNMAILLYASTAAKIGTHTHTHTPESLRCS